MTKSATHSSPVEPDRRAERLLWSIALGLTGLALLWIYFSSQWRMQHDTPLMYYAALLMDQYNRVPYRDFFETSFPGTFLLHLGIVKTTGYSDTAFSWLGLFHLGLVMLFSALFMRPFGNRVALSAPILFALLYISHGPSMILQRDYLVLLPVTLALYLAGHHAPDATTSRWRTALTVGLLFGLAGAIKPQMILGGIPVWLYLSLARPLSDKHTPSKTLFHCGLSMALGGLLVFAPLFLWLWQIGGLPDFWAMAHDYLPLHLALTGDHRLIQGSEYLIYFIKQYIKLGGYAYLLPLAFLGTWWSWHRSPSLRPRLLMIQGVLFMYALVPGMAGQFWPYHWMPFVLPLSLLLGLLFTRTRADQTRLTSLSPLLLLPALWLASPPNWELRLQMQGRPVPAPLHGRVDEIAAFLQQHLKPGDRVQPLDWTAGALHGMLLAKTPLATRFLYDYHFYHHPGHPVTEALRAEFMQEMTQNPPRFVIDVDSPYHPKSFPDAPSFPKLQNWLKNHYRLAHQGKEYRILELNRSTARDPDS